MKKLCFLILISILAFTTAFSSTISSSSKEDYKVIKKAIEKESVSSKEVKWFKILITDSKNQKVKVRVTLPISLIELVVNSCPKSKFAIEEDCKINLKEIFEELKKLGPTALIEIYEEDETVKIWLE